MNSTALAMKNFSRGSPVRNTEMQITIARDGQQMGPYSLEMVNACLAQGMLMPTDMAWYEGAPGWVPFPKEKAQFFVDSFKVIK